tara:strand:- start:912 stop:1595 length:684 start_codon:yes stop_codon:yes gene_type:complete
LAKRLTENQKREIILSFKDGKSIDFISNEFNCTKLTIIRNLKTRLGDSIYKELLKTNKKSIKKNSLEQNEKKQDLNQHNNSDVHNDVIQEIGNSVEIANEGDFYPTSSFLEISPLDYEIENSSRKELSSVPISEVDFPKIVYMIVDKNIELEIKLLKDFPEWRFLPINDLNRKTIEIYLDLKIAKRLCNKEQKVIKVPNTNVFKISAPLLLSKGISRIVSADKLIAL